MRADVACRAVFHCLLLAVAVLEFGPARAQAEVWVDDCAGTGTGTLGDPYCKIQTAICNIKTTGGTIHVLPGTYREAIQEPGGHQAMQLRVAEQYVSQFGLLAKHSNTIVLPANVADVASMIALATNVIKTGNAPTLTPPARETGR